MDKDTICAIASPIGGAIAIIRISGAQAIEITDKIFMAKNKKKNIQCDSKHNTFRIRC